MDPETSLRYSITPCLSHPWGLVHKTTYAPMIYTSLYVMIFDACRSNTCKCHLCTTFCVFIYIRYSVNCLIVSIDFCGHCNNLRKSLPLSTTVLCIELKLSRTQHAVEIISKIISSYIYAKERQEAFRIM
jgi:hypothetical protein